MHKEYCHKHGRTYFYVCPDCAEDMKRVDAERAERKRKWKALIEETRWLPEVSNPTLLQVKMLLADFSYKMNMPYDYGQHNCSDFPQDIQLAASTQGIRCGYVTIAFRGSEVGHAIVAFETDYGLKFFEPQNGNEEDVIVGHRYSAIAEGISENNIISRVEIRWNDGTRTHIE
jgi:hypothetical protein